MDGKLRRGRKKSYTDSINKQKVSPPYGRESERNYGRESKWKLGVLTEELTSSSQVNKSTAIEIVNRLHGMRRYQARLTREGAAS